MAHRRVLLFSDAPVFSGAERYILQLAKDLLRTAYEPALVLGEEGPLDDAAAEAEAAGLPLFRLPAVPTLARRGPFLKLLRFFAAKRFDILHFNLADPRACNGAMTAARLALRTGFVATEHLPQSPFDQRKLPFRHRVALKHTAVTIVNSESYIPHVTNRPGYGGRVVVIPNGIDDPGAATPARRRSAREKLGLPLAGRLIGWVGRVTAQKDPEMLLQVIVQVLEHRKDASFAIIGDGDRLPALRREIQERSLEGRVRMYGHRRDVPELIPAFDLLINTSRYEGMPFSILEAMVQGIPSVTRPIPGIDDLVGPGAAGWISPADTPEAFSRTVVDALKYPQRLAAYGRAARERVLALYSTGRVCTRTVREVYDRI